MMKYLIAEDDAIAGLLMHVEVEVLQDSSFQSGVVDEGFLGVCGIVCLPLDKSVSISVGSWRLVPHL